MEGTTPPVAMDRATVVRGLSYVVDSPDLDLGVPVLRPVFDYWALKRGTRKMPQRSDIDPLELKPYLRHLFLIEVLGHGDFRYRLVGSEITERYGRNSTGKTVREIYAAVPAAADWLSEMLQAVVEQARPVLASGSLRLINKEHLFSQSLHLPLADDGDNVSMIFGAARYTTVGRP